MTSTLEGGEWSAARPGRSLPLGKTRYPLYRRLGGPQDGSGQAKNLSFTRIRSPNRPVRTQSLYRLSYPAHFYIYKFFFFYYFCAFVSVSSPIYFAGKGSVFATLKIIICHQNITYRNLILTSQKTYCVFNINTNRLAFNREIIGIRRANHIKNVNKVFRLIPVHNFPLYYLNFHFNIILTFRYTTFKRPFQTPKFRSNYSRCQCLRLNSTLI